MSRMKTKSVRHNLLLCGALRESTLLLGDRIGFSREKFSMMSLFLVSAPNRGACPVANHRYTWQQAPKGLRAIDFRKRGFQINDETGHQSCDATLKQLTAICLLQGFVGSFFLLDTGRPVYGAKGRVMQQFQVT